MSDSLRSTTKAIHRPRRTALVVFALVKNTIHRVDRVLGATTTFARVAGVPFATASHVLRAALALAIQVAWIARHSSPPARTGSPSRLAIGDTVRFLNGTTEDGERTQIRLASSQGGATVVYVFHPECRLGDAVAPEWAKRFGAPVGLGNAKDRGQPSSPRGSRGLRQRRRMASRGDQRGAAGADGPGSPPGVQDALGVRVRLERRLALRWPRRRPRRCRTGLTRPPATTLIPLGAVK